MTAQRDFTSFILYSFGLILISEWIWPVGELTNTTNIWVFLAFLAVSFIVNFVHPPLLLSLSVKAITIVYILHFLYFEGSFFQPGWVIPFLSEIQTNIVFVFTANLLEISNLFRSLLFFILLWLMSYLLHYWLIQRRKILLFFVMTILYVTILDTFTPYNANVAIVRIVIIGFLVLGVLTFYRLLEKEKMESFRSHKWLIPLSVMIGLSVVFGFAMPKSEPIWPDPVPFIQSLNEKSGSNVGNTMQKVGYGEDDSRLGGPFIGDSTVIFRSEVESLHYWKVETKDVYTGKGWVQSSQDARFIPFSQEEEVPIASFTAGNLGETKIETSHVYQIVDYPHVLYPLGIKTIQADTGYTYELDPSIEKIYSYDRSQSVPISNYSVTYEVPNYSLTALKSNGHSSSASTKFLSQYTQLPETVPQRVKNLAVEITNGKDNWYDQAKAIEQYLKGTKFSYDTKDVMIPEGDDDYVDQFLFESMRGYCDNFSSSMVVMLRSLDIPARWVKGYNEGEYRGSSSNLLMFDVTNDNAHSWVEVYFPNVGWVSFEPTPGFTNNINIQFDEPAAQETQASVPQPEQQEQEEQPNEEPETKDSMSFAEIWNNAKGFINLHLGWIVAVLLAVAAFAYFIYRIRVKWLPFYYIWRFKRLKVDDVERFTKAYNVLLKQLGRYGLQRNKGQTLREYALSIDRHFASTEMSELTARYEKYLYGNRVEKGDLEGIRELWEYLIKKTAS